MRYPVSQRLEAYRQIADWLGFQPSFPAKTEEAGLCYAESYSLVNFLIHEYGKDGTLQLLSAFKEGSTYDGALLEVYGFDMDGLDNLWCRSLGLEPRPLAALLDWGIALLTV